MRNITKVGIVCCSNGQLSEYKADIDKLIALLADKGIEVRLSDYIYAKEGISSGTPRERAEALNRFYRDETIDAIFDISGGDIANEVLGFLDYEMIATSDKQFYGYSDLTTVVNAIYAMTEKQSVLFQVKNLVWDKSGTQDKSFLSHDMYNFKYEFMQGNSMSGVVIGGNIRCLLKLAGTKFFPDVKGKILFLEALSGKEPQLRTYFAQLYEMGVFSQIEGVLLGTYTEYEQDNSTEKLIAIVKEYVGDALPVAKTNDIGHSKLSKALVIGQVYLLS